MSNALFKTGVTLHAGKALFAAASIPIDSVIGSFSSYLTAHDAVVDESVKTHLKTLDFSILPSLNEKLLLTLYLAIHRTGNAESASKHRIAIDQLPTTNQNGVWTDEDDIITTQLGPAIAAKRRVVERQWSSLASQVSSFNSWEWSDSIVSSRCIGLGDALQGQVYTSHYTEDIAKHYTASELSFMFDLPERPNLVLVPIMDLCNHAGINRNARWDVDSSGTPHLLSTRDIQPDEEITISYGDEKTNAELFFNYGFVLPDNPNWSITLQFPPPCDIESEDDKTQYWSFVSDTYGLTNCVTFTSDAWLNKDEETRPENKIMQFWAQKGRLRLTQKDVGVILLSTSLQVLESQLLVQLFSEEDEEEKSLSLEEMKPHNKTVCDTLNAELQAMLSRLEEKLSHVAKDGIARQLLHNEHTACLNILKALESLEGTQMGNDQNKAQ